MMDDFTTQLITTLMSSLQAVTEDGNIDHKVRLSALKEARALLNTILPKMAPKDRETFSKDFSDQLKEKMTAAQKEEQRLHHLLPPTHDDDTLTPDIREG